MHQVTERIIAFNSRRNQRMVKYKYRSMRENLFRFYRGTCHLFYDDLHHNNNLPESPVSWISGDLHLENFGSFRSGNDQVYFDLNDFDEAVLAPLSWELVRFLTSIFIGFDSLGIERKKAVKMARLYLKSYSAALLTGKADYVEPGTSQGIVRDFLRAADKKRQKDILTKRTFFSKKDRQILLTNPKHFPIKDNLREELFVHINQWLKNDTNSPYNYKAVDAIFRIAGTGSVGLNRYTFLLKSLNNTGDKYFLLDMKEASPSSLIPFLTVDQPAWASEADRIISVQKKMQNRTPALLSTCGFRDKDYIMQEMQPTKDSIDFKLLRNRYREMYRVIDIMAVLTASSQLRSSGQRGSAITDSLTGFAADTGWQEPLLDYAAAYAGTVKEYYRQFLEDFGMKNKPAFLPHENAIQPVT
jgi:uncharacterized protein (DUF2252 family)